MKKIFSIVLIALAALSFYSCDTSSKSYSYYFIGTDSWQGADTATMDEVAKVIIQYGYIKPGYTIEGEDLNANDESAINTYDALYEALMNNVSDIQKDLTGKGTDGKGYSVQFLYSLNRGETQWYRLKQQIVTIEVPAAN